MNVFLWCFLFGLCLCLRWFCFGFSCNVRIAVMPDISSNVFPRTSLARLVEKVKNSWVCRRKQGNEGYVQLSMELSKEDFFFSVLLG